jgi:IS30 family transposase
LKNAEAIISERRQKIWTLLTRGMKRYEIAKELSIAQSTVSRDIKYLAADSQKYLNDLAKETLPFMYQMDMEGIRQVLRECWNMYQSEDKSINWFQRLTALKLAKECYEADFKLLNEGPSVLSVRQLEERLMLIENRQVH